MNRALKFRIEPSKAQKEFFEKTFGCCRFLYNQMLSDRKEAAQRGEKLRPRPAMYKGEFPWLKETDSLALCNVQLDLETAFRNYYERPDMGYPKLKSKHHSRRSYTTNAVNGNIRIEGKKIRLPKAGAVRIRIHRKIPEDWKLKSVTVIKDAVGKYYAALLFDLPECENQTSGRTEKKRYLGMDYVMDGLAVLSDGTRADYPKYYRKAQEKLAREQRRLSQCEKGSRNYEKQKCKVAKVHEKVRNQRRDFLHKFSRNLADAYDVIGVEDINMKAMSQSQHFGKSVMDNGYGMLRHVLAYKLEEHGGKLIKVDRWFPSSKRCSCCGKVLEELALSERTYVCSCGNVMGRDVNAAVNIKQEAMRMVS